MPAPAKEVRKLRPGGFVQPALTEFEAAALSDQDLAARGYPRRPDPKDARGHATWLKTVTQPMTFVPARTVANPGVTLGTTCCGSGGVHNTWSGLQLHGAADKSYSFDYVTGTWSVPYVLGANNGPWAYSALWVGLDGADTFIPGTTSNQQDLVQAGTIQDALTTNGTTMAFYHAFYQFLPHDPVSIPITSTTAGVIKNFVVNAGDEIICAVWIGPLDSSQPPSLAAPYAQFAIYNVTQQEYTLTNEPRGTINVPGFEAEWIMERPTVNGQLPDLAEPYSVVGEVVNTSIEVVQVGAEMWGGWARAETPGGGGLFVSPNSKPKLLQVPAKIHPTTVAFSISDFPSGLGAQGPPVPLSSSRTGTDVTRVLFDWYHFN
jgi:hypothetical protein